MAKVTKKKETNMEDIVKCQYAGDPNDEFCCSCNGKTMEIEGETLSCKECQSYTPTPETATEPVAPNESHDAAREDTENNKTSNYTPQGITTSIKAESGLSIETKKGWYRFCFTEERIIPETADIDKEKESLWNSVNSEVDRQAEEIKLLLTEK